MKESVCVNKLKFRFEVMNSVSIPKVENFCVHHTV